MTVEEASMGAVQILTHSMVQSIEENSVRKGYDPRDFALVAEAARAAVRGADRARGRDAVGARADYPGVTAALGLLATDMVYEYVSTVYQRVSKLDAAALEEAFDELEQQARDQLAADGVPADAC
jgi:N-methylhydantoinase A/oxoprolinase/acetone carboxylase beta subunit